MLSKYTPKNISRHVYSGHSIDAPEIPYFQISEVSGFANLTIPGFRDARDFDSIKSHIPNLSKAAHELMKQGFEIGFNDIYCVGRIVKGKYSLMQKNGFDLNWNYYDNFSSKRNPDLESAITSALKILTNAPDTFESDKIFADSTAVLNAEEYLSHEQRL